MSKEGCFPYPTPYEAIRYIARMLDLKESIKFFEDKATDLEYEPSRYWESLEKNLFNPIEKYLGSDANRIISNWLNRANEDYLKLVSSCSADGISRMEMIPLLQSGFIKDLVVEMVLDIHDHFGGPQPAALFSGDIRTVETTLSWIEQHEAGWSGYKSALGKDEKDRISAWRRGDDLPSSQRIYLLQKSSKGPWPEQINWQRVRVLLFIARSIDFLRRELKTTHFIDEVRVSLWGGINSSNLPLDIRNLQDKCMNKIADVWPLIAEIQAGLKRTSTKNKADEMKGCLDSFRARLAGTEEQFTTGYWIDWHEARWHVFSGDLESAKEFYKLAFEGSLFRSGKHQQEIIEEALVVASSLEKRDKVFLKHLKWMAINFGYDIPSANTRSPSNTFSDSVEGWEVDLWQSQLGLLFPDSGLYQGVSYKDRKAVRRLPIVTSLNHGQPDFRYPDRKKKNAGTRSKPMPQLVWYIAIQEFDVVDKLVKAGAKVNVASSDGVTPILKSLQELDPIDLPTPSLDERFFWLISGCEHDSTIINRRTQKTRSLPIIAAVKTGRPNIVEKVLELGANPNGRGLTDEQTVLYFCLGMIARVKNPKNASAMPPPTAALYDSMRRHSMGTTGFTLDHQRQAFSASRKDPLFMKFEQEVLELQAKSYQRAIDIDSMRDIGTILIKAGADVNAEHVDPIKGYTPLMLAAELDESELFELMLEKGGDPKKHYLHPDTNEEINCHQISKAFGSDQVLRILN